MNLRRIKEQNQVSVASAIVTAGSKGNGRDPDSFNAKHLSMSCPVMAMWSIAEFNLVMP